MRRQRGWIHAGLLSASCFGLMFALWTSIGSPAGSGAVTPPRNGPKCTIDITAGKQSDCTVVKANHEWILWSNTSVTARSVHFKSNDNPFVEKSCWDTDAGARARSGPVALGAVAKAYVFYTSDVPCAANPPDASRSAAKVIVQ